MKQPTTDLQKLILKYIKKNQTFPNKTLARKIFNETGGKIGTVEMIRNRIREYKHGGFNNSGSFSPALIPSAKMTPKEGLEKLSKLKSKSIKRKNVVLPVGLYYILSDIHFPLHDEIALNAALKHIADEKRKITGIILNGDILDQYHTSRFLHTRKDFSITDEIEICRDFLNTLRAMFPTQRIIYKQGNHDVRFLHYLIRNAPELAAVPEFSLPNLLWLDDFNIDWVENEIIKAGKLNILHGHEFGESIFSPVNPARGIYLRAKSSTLIGHYHQVSEHTEGNMNGDLIGCYSTGCLCELTPEYRPFAYTKWSHGFAEVNILERGMFRVKNYKILNGEVI